MNAAFGAITGNSIEEAVGQIVATVVEDVGPNTGVLFEIDGQRTSVPIANGSQASGPVYLIEFLYRRTSGRRAGATGRARPPRRRRSAGVLHVARHAKRGAPDHRCSRS